ncbi:hypothetical protein [Sporisorium scitamineum]|uniref:Uncharacterized protein n=1 Tax=Sporisorium scitamineum TaxID=49012 RepID=A0A0F7S3L5_9BASI|nr:hypothetical protein [Sporisorium scitamineum]
MLATPKSTPRKAAANGSSTPAASPSTASTPSRLTRAQARASGTPIKTPSPLKKGGSISTPKASSKKAAASAAAVEEKEHDTPSPSKPKSKTPTKVATPAKSSPKSASSKKKSSPAKIDTETPRKVLASHAKLTRIPTSALATAEPIVADSSSRAGRRHPTRRPQCKRRHACRLDCTQRSRRSCRGAKASRTQRIKINNEPALRRMYEDIRLDSPTSSSKLPWIETMRITYPTSISTEVTDVENDLERELAFYKQALHAAVEGKKLVQASGTPFTRPSDYFAEMVKTDEHMERIRQKLLDESAAIKASEAAKKQRELKKFGKKVQVEKLQERIRNKKELNERIAGLKRKHGSIEDASGADADEFDVRLEEAIGGPSAAADTKKPKLTAKRAPTNKAKMPRNARDAKYGFGGKKRYSKSNTAESTNDFSLGPTRGARGSKPKVTSGKTGFRAKQKSGAAKRPGKARRAAGH